MRREAVVLCVGSLVRAHTHTEIQSNNERRTNHANGKLRFEPVAATSFGCVFHGVSVSSVSVNFTAASAVTCGGRYGSSTLLLPSFSAQDLQLASVTGYCSC
jgi:hypothetical protein